MRRALTFVVVLLTLGSSGGHSQAAAQQSAVATPPPQAAANPLLGHWTGPFGGVPPWQLVKPELFPPAFESAIAEERSEIAAIASSAQPPTFENTIAAMERAGETGDRVTRLFSVMTSNMNSPEYQKLDREWQPKFAAATDDIFFNERLFKRIEEVHGSLPTPTLAPDQQRLTTLVYDSFVRRGARLDAAGKAQ